MQKKYQQLIHKAAEAHRIEYPSVEVTLETEQVQDINNTIKADSVTNK